MYATPNDRWQKWLGGITEMRVIRPGGKPQRVLRRSHSVIDEPCVALCQAINQIPGIKTTSSCCGHGEVCLDIWFHAVALAPLHVIVRAIDRNYGAPGGWALTVHGTDLPEKAICFRLASRSKGVNAFVEAERVAASIIRHLQDADYCTTFGLESSL